MYIIKKLVVSYKKPFWLENQCKFIKGVYNLQTFFAFYISLEISSIFLKKMMYIIFYLIPQYFFSSAVVPWLSPSSALSHLCTLLNISFLALSKFSGLVIRVKTTR